MNMSTTDGWETPPTTTDDNAFYSEEEPRLVHWNPPLDEIFHSEDEPRRIYLLPSPSQRSPPQNLKINQRWECPYQEKTGVAALLRSLRTIDSPIKRKAAVSERRNGR